ncbi:MAG TPA: TMEM175 family protein [Balneolaceae bacterium]|nr:TMEM175 family protein [Balneolaceae bacterium]
MMKKTSRLEAFSDGVLAIIITIMVLELKVPKGADLAALRPLLPVFLGYILSFVYLGIYWSNHHHLLHITEKISGGVLWANLNLLFWLSLFPFATAWMGNNSSVAIPTAFYGCVLFLAAFAWFILQRLILANHSSESLLVQVMGVSFKEKISPVLYLAAIFLAFIKPWISDIIYVGVALVWIIPDRRIERAVAERQKDEA